jgi:hypothetical protein
VAAAGNTAQGTVTRGTPQLHSVSVARWACVRACVRCRATAPPASRERPAAAKTTASASHAALSTHLHGRRLHRLLQTNYSYYHTAGVSGGQRGASTAQRRQRHSNSVARRLPLSLSPAQCACVATAAACRQMSHE